MPIGTPSFSSIRQWLLRVGLYVLEHHGPKRSDWIWIIDLTVELGPAKCLVVLGIAQADWQQHVLTHSCSLQHQDVTVLAIEVLETCNGTVIEQTLEQLGQRVGHPLQIVSDHGCDLKSGIKRYAQPPARELLQTYDVTHAMACLLKHTLQDDSAFQQFLSHCHQCRQHLQQTKLSFLRPPAQRTKARYFALESLLDWAQGVLCYYQQGDFSLITTAHGWDEKTLCQVIETVDVPTLTRLALLNGQQYANRHAFSQMLNRLLTPEQVEQFGPLICQAADLGRREFEHKFHWLLTQPLDLTPYAQRVRLVMRANQYLKHHGLNHHSHTRFAEATADMALSPDIEAFRAKVIAVIEQEATQIPPGQTWLATSDVIESLFGKYKLFSQRSPLKEVGLMILTLPLCTVDLTTALVKQALETVRGIDVATWAQQTLGPSMFAQRRAVLNPKIDDTEVAWKIVPTIPA